MGINIKQLTEITICYNICCIIVMSGWGLDVFTKPNYYWWIVPVVTSHVGAVLGAWIYYLAIGREDDPLPHHFAELQINI